MSWLPHGILTGLALFLEFHSILWADLLLYRNIFLLAGWILSRYIYSIFMFPISYAVVFIRKKTQLNSNISLWKCSFEKDFRWIHNGKVYLLYKKQLTMCRCWMKWLHLASFVIKEMFDHGDKEPEIQLAGPPNKSGRCQLCAFHAMQPIREWQAKAG